MTDYIKREDALNTARNTFTGMTADTMELRINDIPSADVAPVRHGRWIVGDGGNGWNDWYVFECPLCGIKIEDRNGRGVDWAYNYCPNCGAKMDGDADD